MKIIGITGGVGSGKSRVLSYMEEQFKAVICQADHVAWELQEPGQKCYIEIVEHFGREILHDDGTINRKKLGQIVFNNQDELLVLNEIMHPAVKEAIVEQIKMEREKKTEYFVLEAALLLEDGYKQICDEMWYIYTDEMTRRLRLKESRAYSDEKID
jgi:dephospho-CoA kinase